MSCGDTRLMAFSVRLTRFVVVSHLDTVREILTSAVFVDYPVKEAATELMFHRAMGFAPHDEYWRRLRLLASAHAFSSRRIFEARWEAMARRGRSREARAQCHIQWATEVNLRGSSKHDLDVVHAKIAEATTRT
ncbi:hypothetical protein ABZP36_031703 [Zizania latifolia]